MFALVVALYLSLLVPLGFLAGGREWIAWFLGFGALVFVLGAVGRGIGLDPRKVGLIQILALPPAQIAAFAGQEAWFWVIPNREVVERFFDVGQALARSFLVEIAPLSPSTGLFALIGISGGLVAWACDWYTFALRVPANTGVFAALVLVVTVSFVREGLPVWAMAPTAAAYLGLLAVTAPGSRPRFGSLAVVAGGVSLGLVASLLPGLGGGPLVEGGNPGLIGAIALPGGEETVQRVSSRQALVDVSRDLVERGNFEVLRYATAAQEPVYLRLTALSRFDGGEWLHDEGPQESFSLPTDRDQDRAMAFDAPAQPVTGVDEVAVELVALDSPWLPAPYMTLDLWGAGGSVDVDTLDRTISAGGGGLPESYTALWGLPAGGVAGSRDAPAAGGGGGLRIVGNHPSYEELSDPSVYLELPSDLPPIIGETAWQAVVGVTARGDEASAVAEAMGMNGNLEEYAEAVALVDYFQTAGFEYSLDAPAEWEDAGDQGQVIARFLEDRSGYCVHFAAAMTLMARELGIPARIAVGYLPGRRVDSAKPAAWGLADDGREVGVYSVGASRLHSWPELYIDGFGWLGFEPTVGRGGSAAASPAPTASQSESPSPSASASASAESSASPGARRAPRERRDQGPAAPVAVWAVIVFGALAAAAAAPGGFRGFRRWRRLRGGGLGAVWREVGDTAHDLGIGPPAWRTPADFSAEIGAVLRGAGQGEAAADLDRLRLAVEEAAYGPGAGTPRPAAPVADPGPESPGAVAPTAAPAPAAADAAPGSEVPGAAVPTAGPAPAAAEVRPGGVARVPAGAPVDAQGRAVVRALVRTQPRRIRVYAWWFPRSLFR